MRHNYDDNRHFVESRSIPSLSTYPMSHRLCGVLCTCSMCPINDKRRGRERERKDADDICMYNSNWMAILWFARSICLKYRSSSFGESTMEHATVCLIALVLLTNHRIFCPFSFELIKWTVCLVNKSYAYAPKQGITVRINLVGFLAKWHIPTFRS